MDNVVKAVPECSRRAHLHLHVTEKLLPLYDHHRPLVLSIVAERARAAVHHLPTLTHQPDERLIGKCGVPHSGRAQDELRFPAQGLQRGGRHPVLIQKKYLLSHDVDKGLAHGLLKAHSELRPRAASADRRVSDKLDGLFTAKDGQGNENALAVLRSRHEEFEPEQFAAEQKRV